MNEMIPTCHRAEMLINRRLDRECSHGESTELDQHLATCAQCRSEYRSARGLEVLFAQLAVPDSSAAQARFKARMGELVRSTPASKPITQLKLQPSRRRVWFPALAALLAVALVGAMAFLIQRNPNTPEVALLSVRFDDRISILETLNERTLQAASQTPGTELARTHDQLATDLAASIQFESNDRVARDEAAVSYIRTHTLALFPELQEGLLGRDQLSNFQARRQALSIAKPETSTLSMATAVSSYAVEYLEGRASTSTTFTTPKAGTSLQSAFSDATLAMRDVSHPLDRAQILDQIAERVVMEAARDTLAPADAARLQNVATVLSSRGTQNQLRLALRDARDGEALRIASLLKSDAARLETLQSLAEKLPPQQQERVMGTLAVTRGSNRKMQETLTPPAEKKSPAPTDTPSTKPGEAAPQKTTDTALPPQNTPAIAAPAQVPVAAPAVAVPGPAQAPAANPGNGAVIVSPAGNGNTTETIQGKEGNNPQAKNPESGKDSAPGQIKSAEKGKDSAPGQIKKTENAEGLGKTPQGGAPNGNVTGAKNSAAGKERSEAAASRGGPPEKAERPEAIDRPEKPERPERPERPESLERPDRPEKTERADKPERAETGKPEKAERPDKPEKPERPERPEVPEKPDRPDKPDKPDTPENNGGGNNGGGNNGGGNNGGGTGNGGGTNPNKPEKPEKPEKPDKPKK